MRDQNMLNGIVADVNHQGDPVMEQSVKLQKSMCPFGTITTEAGAPVEYKEATSSLNTNLLSNEHLIDILTHAVRERIPERVVHAPGTGAFGYFVTTHDISHICKAKLFSEVGKKTPVAVRFSLTGPRRGVADTTRETSRGFAVKFYTEEGNLDLTALNTPCFTFKDPLLFPHLSQVLKPNLVTNLPDPNILWDFLTLHPESMYQTLYLLSDYGYPYTYRHMSAYPIHTYQVYNKEGRSRFIRFHFIPDAGVKHLNDPEAMKLAGNDPDYYTRDLCNAIANGEYPSWQLKIQIVSEEEAKSCDCDIFDVTTTLPLQRFPLHVVGTIVLNKNPTNHHAEIEQLAFCPGNLVPGILGSPGKLFEARRFTYREAQSYRLGSNFKKIPVNVPSFQAVTYNGNDLSPVNDNWNDAHNYYPNSFNGPIPYVDKNRPQLLKIHEKETNNFKQAGDFYANELNFAEKRNLVRNIVKSIGSCENKIKNRIVNLLTNINSDLGDQVTQCLADNCG